MAEPEKARILIVSADEAGQRLDNYLLRHLKGVPRSHVYRLLRTGQVRVNRGRNKAHYKLAAGDAVRLPPVRQAEPDAPARPGGGLVRLLESAILHESDDLLVLNKPAGLAVHGGSGVNLGAIEALRAMRPEARFLELVHRLDRETSGCLLVAKKRSMLRGLHALLRDGAVEKRYLALLAGRWRRPGEVRLALRKNQMQGGERMVQVAADGKDAISRFVLREHFPDATLTEVRILTGRTHQIRVHAAQAGHPVLGDDKYGDRQANRAFREYGLKRMFLHAAGLAFDHPGTGEPLRFEAPLDAELAGVVAKLKTAT